MKSLELPQALLLPGHSSFPNTSPQRPTGMFKDVRWAIEHEILHIHWKPPALLEQAYLCLPPMGDPVPLHDLDVCQDKSPNQGIRKEATDACARRTSSDCHTAHPRDQLTPLKRAPFKHRRQNWTQNLAPKSTSMWHWASHLGLTTLTSLSLK